MFEWCVVENYIFANTKVYGLLQYNIRLTVILCVYFHEGMYNRALCTLYYRVVVVSIEK